MKKIPPRPPRRAWTWTSSIVAVFGVVALSAAGSSALAQAFPAKPVRLVVGPAPDLLPRILSQKLGEAWGQQVVVDQRPGAGGVIAAETVAKAAPDGYTWLLSSSSYLIIEAVNANLPYDFQRDLTGVSMMATLPFILAVNPAVPARSLDELLALARAKPGGLNYASSGPGTSAHLVGEMLKTMAKVDLVHVPYKGVAPAVADLLGGQVQAMFAIAQAALPHVQSGKLRALAVTSRSRYAALPAVPTVAESGFPDFEAIGWNGIHVPARTPRAIVDRIHDDVQRVLALPDVRERLVATGFEPTQWTVDELDAYVRKDIARYRKVVKEANVRVD